MQLQHRNICRNDMKIFNSIFGLQRTRYLPLSGYISPVQTHSNGGLSNKSCPCVNTTEALCLDPRQFQSDKRTANKWPWTHGDSEQASLQRQADRLADAHDDVPMTSKICLFIADLCSIMSQSSTDSCCLQSPRWQTVPLSPHTV